MSRTMMDRFGTPLVPGDPVTADGPHGRYRGIYRGPHKGVPGWCLVETEGPRGPFCWSTALAEVERGHRRLWCYRWNVLDVNGDTFASGFTSRKTADEFAERCNMPTWSLKRETLPAFCPPRSQ